MRVKLLGSDTIFTPKITSINWRCIISCFFNLRLSFIQISLYRCSCFSGLRNNLFGIFQNQVSCKRNHNSYKTISQPLKLVTAISNYRRNCRKWDVPRQKNTKRNYNLKDSKIWRNVFILFKNYTTKRIWRH